MPRKINHSVLKVPHFLSIMVTASQTVICDSSKLCGKSMQSSKLRFKLLINCNSLSRQISKLHFKLVVNCRLLSSTSPILLTIARLMVYLTLHVVTCVIKQVVHQIIRLTRFHKYVLHLLDQVDGLCTALVFCLSYAIVCMPNTSNSLSVAQLQCT